jgi:hypothetical protein
MTEGEGMKNIGLLVAGPLVVAWVATAQARTEEEKCLEGRARAQGRYEQCVQRWLGKTYGGRLWVPYQVRL